MVMKRIKKDDNVIVRSGRDKGRTGKVIKHVGKDRVLVAGVNLVSKHEKPNPQKQIRGGIVKKEASIHISNVALLNPNTKKADRAGFKFVTQSGGKKKVRYFKSNDEMVEI